MQFSVGQVSLVTFRASGGRPLPPLPVVALAVDVAAGAVLHPLEPGALAAGEARAVGAAAALVAGDAGLLALQPPGLAPGQLAGADARMDAVLLMALALVDAGLGRRGGGDCRAGGQSGGEKGTDTPVVSPRDRTCPEAFNAAAAAALRAV
jgi:hypothetical protein